jgi:hypothetical protein
MVKIKRKSPTKQATKRTEEQTPSKPKAFTIPFPVLMPNGGVDYTGFAECWEDLHEYEGKYRELALQAGRRAGATKRLREFVFNEYENLFLERPSRAVPIVLVHAAVAYEFQYRGFAKYGKESLLGPKVLARREASRELRMDAYDSRMRAILENRIRQDQPETEENALATTKTKKTSDAPAKRGRKGFISKSSGLTVQQYWKKLFEDNFKQKKTDDQLAAIMRKEFPKAKHYEDSDIRTHRSLYNTGRLLALEGKIPAKLSTPYTSDGHEAPTRTRSATRKAIGSGKVKKAVLKKTAKKATKTKPKVKKKVRKKAA